MGYANTSGVHRGAKVITKASAAETSSTTHSAVATGDENGLAVVTVAVTAASGTTPTLIVVVEGSIDNGSTWFELGRVGSDGVRVGSVGTAPANFTTSATTVGAVPATERVRTRSVVGGTTPSFTYSVTLDLS